MKSVLWRVVKRLSYIQDARCLKVKVHRFVLLSAVLCGCETASHTEEKRLGAEQDNLA